MRCEDKFWRYSEEANAEHVEDLNEEIRYKFSLDESAPPEEWGTSEECWHLARKVDCMAEDVAVFVDSGFTQPPADFALKFETIRGRRIRRVDEEDPRTALWEALGMPPEPPKPYVAIDVEAEDLLRTLVRHRLGYERRHWDVGRVIQIAASGVTARSERGKAYLGRLLLCHVLDLESEMIVWARSVLEAELEFALEETTADTAPDATLVDLTHLACNRDILSGAAVEAAHRVREAGNDALHVMLGLWSRKAVLKNLQIVLRAI